MSEVTGVLKSDSPFRVLPGERLIKLQAAAVVLGCHRDTLENWYKAGYVPMVGTPGDRVVFHSWVAAVLASARPGRRGDIAEVSRAWWAEHGIAMEAAA